MSRLISFGIFILIQMSLMLLQLIAGAIGILMAVVTFIGMLSYQTFKWLMPKLYRKALEWRFK